MSKRSFNPLLALMGLTALTFVALLYYLLSGDPGPVNEVDAGRGTVEVAAPAEDALQEPELAPTADANPAREEVAAVEEESEPEEPPLAEDDVVWIEGRVLFSPDTPRDEQAYVISIDRERSLPALYNDFGPARAAWEGTYEGGLRDQPPLLAHRQEQDRKRQSGPYGRTPRTGTAAQTATVHGWGMFRADRIANG